MFVQDVKKYLIKLITRSYSISCKNSLQFIIKVKKNEFFIISVKSSFGLFFKKVVFKTVNTISWQSRRPINVVVVFWKAKELLVKKGQ